MSELTGLTLEAWRALSSPNRRAAAESIADRSRGALVFLRLQGSDALELPMFAHAASKVVFQLVPGGPYRIGFSEEEWATLEEQYKGWDEADAVDGHLGADHVRPTVEVELRPFLLATRALDGTQIEYLGASAEERATLEASVGRKRWDFEKVKKLPAASYLKYLDESSSGNLETLEDVDRVEGQLHALGLRLPSEAEWEVAARGGRACPFPHGDRIPDQPGIGSNPFGFVNLGGEAEICADRYAATREGTARDGSPRREGAARVVRGGAANIYPWQGCGEWTLLLCAMRGDGESDEGFFAIRPALDLPQREAV